MKNRTLALLSSVMLLMLSFSHLPAGRFAHPKRMVICVAVTDLRNQRIERQDIGFEPLQETQLLFGEFISATEKKGDWLYVVAMEQPVNIEGVWSKYNGWINAKHAREVEQFPSPSITVKVPWAKLHKLPLSTSEIKMYLSIGTRLEGFNYDEKWWQVWSDSQPIGFIAHADVEPFKPLTPKNIHDIQEPWTLRTNIINTAKQFIGMPYCWGGRSAFDGGKSETITGVDCSSLIQLAYRVNGIELPRDAHDQYLKSTEVSNLMPGDVVFIASQKNPKRITQVMLYLDKGMLLEAPSSGKNVQTITIEEKLGILPDDLKNAMETEKGTVYLGTYIDLPQNGA